MNLFVGWFFICILTTITHVFDVANVARAAGAVLGLLLGYAIVLPGCRALIAGSIAALVLFGFFGSTIGRPFINFSSQGGYEEGKWGYDALVADRNQEAVRWLRDAVKYQPKVSSYWFNLGMAYQRLNIKLRPYPLINELTSCNHPTLSTLKLPGRKWERTSRAAVGGTYAVADSPQGPRFL